jgi:hypothetical protein
MMVASEREWANGYYMQALADMRAARVLQGQEPSVLAMLLQMVLEKLSKAALLRGGQISIDEARRSHRSASTLVHLIAKSSRVCGHLGLVQVTVRNLLAPVVDDLERSHPSLTAGGPSLEYPWLSLSGEIQWPAEHLEVARRFRPKSVEGQRLFDLAERLCARFDHAFP